MAKKVIDINVARQAECLKEFCAGLGLPMPVRPSQARELGIHMRRVQTQTTKALEIAMNDVDLLAGRGFLSRVYAVFRPFFIKGNPARAYLDQVNKAERDAVDQVADKIADDCA